MADSHDEQSKPTNVASSILWEIYIPFLAAAVPAGIFALLGLAQRGLDQPNAEVPDWKLAIISALQVLGMIAMAVVILVRFDHASRELSNYAQGQPAVWRKLALVISIGWLLVFDVLTNLAASLAGAQLLLVLAIPAFLGYLACGRVALMGLKESELEAP